jgi:Tol biopolymer transport system component
MSLHKKFWLGRFFLAIALTLGLNGCSDQGFLTPPTQQFGATLNSQGNDLHPRFSYQGNYLVFDSDRQSQQGIYLYDVRKRVLIDLPGLNQPNSFQYQPDLSADGRYLVYVSEEEGQTDIFLYDRQSLEKENLTKDELGEVRHPTMSGNGRFVAFEMNRNGQWDLIIFDRGSKAEITLPETAPLDPSNAIDNNDQSSPN